MMTTRSHKIPRWDLLEGDGSVAHFAESGLERKVDWRRPGDGRETFPGFRVVSPHFRLLSRGCSVHWLYRSTHTLPIWVGRGRTTLGDNCGIPRCEGPGLSIYTTLRTARLDVAAVCPSSSTVQPTIQFQPFLLLALPSIPSAVTFLQKTGSFLFCNHGERRL